MRRLVAPVALWLLAAGCAVPPLDEVGKRCAVDRPCAAPLVCAPGPDGVARCWRPGEVYDAGPQYDSALTQASVTTTQPREAQSNGAYENWGIVSQPVGGEQTNGAYLHRGGFLPRIAPP